MYHRVALPGWFPRLMDIRSNEKHDAHHGYRRRYPEIVQALLKSRGCFRFGPHDRLSTGTHCSDVDL